MKSVALVKTQFLDCNFPQKICSIITKNETKQNTGTAGPFHPVQSFNGSAPLMNRTMLRHYTRILILFHKQIPGSIPLKHTCVLPCNNSDLGEKANRCDGTWQLTRPGTCACVHARPHGGDWHDAREFDGICFAWFCDDVPLYRRCVHGTYTNKTIKMQCLSFQAHKTMDTQMTQSR